MDPLGTEAAPSTPAVTADVRDLRQEVTAEFAQLRAEVRQMKADILRAMVLQTAAIVGLNVALIKLLP